MGTIDKLFNIGENYERKGFSIDKWAMIIGTELQDIVELDLHQRKQIAYNIANKIFRYNVDDVINILERYGCPKNLSEQLAIGLMEQEVY